jgi:hypothetical protein
MVDRRVFVSDGAFNCAWFQLGLIERLTLWTELRPHLKSSSTTSAFRIGSIFRSRRSAARERLIFLSYDRRDRPTIDIADMRTIPEEPASDDFHSFVPLTCAGPFGADEQVSFYPRTRASAFHLLNYWQNPPAELKHLTRVVLKVMVFLSASTAVERAFSIARSVTTDYQMAMTQETVSERVMIQANWRLAQPLMANVRAMGRDRWSQVYRELEPRKLTQHRRPVRKKRKESL